MTGDALHSVLYTHHITDKKYRIRSSQGAVPKTIVIAEQK